MDFVIPPDTRLGHVHLTVNDLDRQIEFYQRVLGLHLNWRQSDQAGLGWADSDLLLLSQDTNAVRVRGTTGLYHFAVLFPTRREFARAVARLFSLRYPNYPTDHLMTETTYLDDPEGNGIELYFDTPERGRWDMENDRFAAIDTEGNPHSGREPLDVEGLLEELQPEDRLDQMVPSGTTIGHVHLHVASLSEANRFYTDVLGFEIQGVSNPMGVSFVSAGGYHHHIGLNVWLGEGAPAQAEGALGLRYFEIVLPEKSDLPIAVDRLKMAGVPTQDFERGVLMHDPSSNPILLSSSA